MHVLHLILPFYRYRTDFRPSLFILKNLFTNSKMFAFTNLVPGVCSCYTGLLLMKSLYPIDALIKAIKFNIINKIFIDQNDVQKDSQR